jgi:hypothetical protein
MSLITRILNSFISVDLLCCVGEKSRKYPGHPQTLAVDWNNCRNAALDLVGNLIF